MSIIVIIARDTNYKADRMVFEEVHIDLIGPWKVDLKGGREIEINALTCIEQVTNLVETIKIENKTAEHVSRQFENCWLSRYP